VKLKRVWPSCQLLDSYLSCTRRNHAPTRISRLTHHEPPPSTNVFPRRLRTFHHFYQSTFDSFYFQIFRRSNLFEIIIHISPKRNNSCHLTKTRSILHNQVHVHTCTSSRPMIEYIVLSDVKIRPRSSHSVRYQSVCIMFLMTVNFRKLPENAHGNYNRKLLVISGD
jgi:hypothetical protein